MLMDNQNTFQSSVPPTPAPAPTVPSAAPAPAKKTGNVILIAILCLILGAAIAVGIIVGINGGFNFGGKSSDGGSSSSPKVDDEITEEVAIEDTDLIASLTKKANIVIAGTISSERSLKNIEYSGNIGDYQSMTSEMKSREFLSASIRNIDNSEEVKVSDLPSSVASKETLIEQAGADYVISSMRVTDSMRNDYKDIFGEELIMIDKVDASKITGCTYTYVPEMDSYVMLLLGCGGGSDHWALSYQTKHTKQGKNAYVYFALGQIDSSDESYVYMRSDVTVNSDIVERFDDWDSASAYKIDASNYAKYTQYRAVFEENEEGNYIYKTFEKVNE